MEWCCEVTSVNLLTHCPLSVVEFRFVENSVYVDSGALEYNVIPFLPNMLKDENKLD